ncbi:hypothetical protein D3C78_1933770 [compost metagenome]
MGSSGNIIDASFHLRILYLTKLVPNAVFTGTGVKISPEGAAEIRIAAKPRGFGDIFQFHVAV